jgi:hypothetical protein
MTLTAGDIPDGGTAVRNGNYLPPGMVLIQGGTFMMGANEAGHGGHVVTLGDFYIDIEEVRQGTYETYAIANSLPMPAQPASNAALPVVNVTWGQASAFAGSQGKRLPTEAEFEYVMRGGAAYNQRYPWGNTIGAGNANYGFNVGAAVATAGYPATGPGVRDIAGNVWEWCQDWHQNTLNGPVVDPAGAGSGTARVIRGGSWASGEMTCRVYSRHKQAPGKGYADIGFRCVLPVSGGSGAGGDADNDGLPDWWESWYFGSAAACNASADPDGDGMITWQEFVAGSSPTNSGSGLRLQASVVTNGISIQWPSVQGRLYTIDRSVALPTFNVLTNNIPATPLQNTYIDTSAIGPGPYYYRVRVQ